MTTTTAAPAPSGGKPGPANTGVPPGTSLRVVNGDQTFSTTGQVISGLDVHGKVRITADNVTLKDSIVRGPSGGGCGNGAGIQVEGKNDLVEDTEVALSNPTACLDGVWASNATLLRLNVHNSVDGLKLESDARLAASWVHDLHWFASDPNQGGGATHNDAVQILDGASIRLDGNNLDSSALAQANSALQVTQDFGPVTGLVVTGNWMDGGGCSMNLAHKTLSSLTVTANGNRFGHHTSFNCPILLSTKTTLLGSGNVWDDTGQAAPIQRHD